MDQVLQMIPGGAGKALRGAPIAEDAFVQVEAVICSMTREERANPRILNGSRRRRVALGSGTKVQDVNRLIKQFNVMQKMMKRMGQMGKGRKGMAMPLVG
jgi:signal recognition particle subunit SRP54